MSARTSLLLSALVLAACSRTQPSLPTHDRFHVPTVEGVRYYKGNTHTHTTMSDGDSPPVVVAEWYKQHGYDFLVLTDHNVLVEPRTVPGVADDAFLLVPGEEVTTRYEKIPIHVNGLNLGREVTPRDGTDLVNSLQLSVDGIRDAGGVPHVNHPNFKWAFDDHVLAQLTNNRLFEIFNGHPEANNFGGGPSPSGEEVWDRLLSSGHRIFGIAVDDAHHFQGEFAAARANPGRGWVGVRAPKLEARALMQALEAGQFYASTGVVIEDVAVTEEGLAVHMKQVSDERFTTHFIGTGGRLLAISYDNPAVFWLEQPEAYVRAKVYSSRGSVAWVQPAFTR